MTDQPLRAPLKIAIGGLGTMNIINISTEENPATGRNTALSVIALLRRLTATMMVES